MTMSSRDAGASDAVVVLYTNYRGETAVRRIVVRSLHPMWFGATAWHTDPQWHFSALDLDKGQPRDFALSGIKAWGREAVDAALSPPAVPVPEEVRRLSEAVSDYLVALDAEPEKDCWDTESGQEEPGAQKFASDWSWHDHHERIQAARKKMREVLAAPPAEPLKLGPQSWQDMERMPIGGVKTVLLSSAAPPAGRVDEGGCRADALAAEVFDAIALPCAGDRERVRDVIRARWDALCGPFHSEGFCRAIPGSWSRNDLCEQFADAVVSSAPAADSGRVAAGINVVADQIWGALGALETPERLGGQEDAEATTQTLGFAADTAKSILRSALRNVEAIEAAPAPAGATEDGWRTRAADEVDQIADLWSGDGRAYAKTIAAMLRAEEPAPPAEGA